MTASDPSSIPGLRPDGSWDLPEDLNMAAQALAQEGHKTALIDLTSGARQAVTYAALSQRVDQIAQHLLRGRDAPVRPGDRVGVLLGQSLDCVAAHLAIWKIGAISVPLFKLFQRSALESRISDSAPVLVLCDAEGAPLLEGLAPRCITGEIPMGQFHAPLDVSRDRPLPFAPTGPDTPAILIYTSGTTGAPKGALHGHRLLTGHLPGVWKSHDHLGQPGDCLWTPADWAWIGGLFDVALPGLALGVPVVAARLEKFTAEACEDVLRRGGVRNVFFPPTALRLLKSAPPMGADGCAGQGLRALRSVASGGEPLGAEMLAWGQRHLGLTINEFYGQTECNMVVSSCAAEHAPRPGAMGKPVPGYEVAVIDARGQATAGEGDVAIRRGGAAMMLRYWNRPAATDDKFRSNWMLTGDRGQMEEGFVRFIGREDDVISSAGYRIGPSEIEDCLMTHPGVATVGVVGKPDLLRGEIVKAYVVPVPGVAVSEAALQAHVKTRLARHAYPREVTFLDALPLTVTGKVIRKALKQRAFEEGESP